MLYFSPWKTALHPVGDRRSGCCLPRRTCIPEPVRDAMPGWLPKKAMTLGLDLQGGSHILMQVDRKALIADKQAVLEDDIRAVLRDAKIGYRLANPATWRSTSRCATRRSSSAAKTALEPLTAAGGLRPVRRRPRFRRPSSSEPSRACCASN